MMERILNVSQTFANKNATTMFGNFQLVNSSLTGNYSVLHGDLQTKPPLPSFLDSSNYDYNYYLEDLSSLRVPWVEDRAFLPTTITYSVAFIAGVLGNGLVVVSLMMDKKWQTATSSFLVSLGISDLVFLLICVPYELMMRLSSAWSGGMALCKIAGFVEMMTASASVLNLAAVSVERWFFDMCHSLRLKSLKLQSLEHRRLIADLTMCYNIIRGHSCIESSSFFTPNHNTTSRGHPYRLSASLAIINVRNHFFSNRIISVDGIPFQLN